LVSRTRDKGEKGTLYDDHDSTGEDMEHLVGHDLYRSTITSRTRSSKEKTKQSIDILKSNISRHMGNILNPSSDRSTLKCGGTDTNIHLNTRRKDYLLEDLEREEDLGAKKQNPKPPGYTNMSTKFDLLRPQFIGQPLTPGLWHHHKLDHHNKPVSEGRKC